MTDFEAGLEPDVAVPVPVTGEEPEASNGHETAAPSDDVDVSSETSEAPASDDAAAPDLAASDAEEPEEDVEPPTPYVPLRYVEVVMDLPNTNPILILEESDEPRRQLRIPIGLPEGVAISYADYAISTPRPLTHKLFAQVIDWMGGTVEAVRITDVENNSFSAELICSGPNGMETFECRTSDAVALVLRQYLPAPITAAPHVLAAAGVVVDDTSI